MEKYSKILENLQLFAGMSEEDIFAMLKCLNSTEQHFERDSYIFLVGDKITKIGIVLEGYIQIEKEDMEGNRVVVASFKTGDIFAEAICCAGITESPVNVKAVLPCKIIFIDFQSVFQTCKKACLYHGKLIENMLFLIANKNLLLQQRMDFLNKRTLKLKILSYLHSFIESQNSVNITIPFDREELADFFCVDRSALSHELSRLKKDGYIDYHKNHFRLLKKPT